MRDFYFTIIKRIVMGWEETKKDCLARLGSMGALEVVATRASTNGVDDSAKDSSDDVERANIRERVGLTYEQLCRTVKEGLVAETIVMNRDGLEVGRVPANSERAKFVAAAVDIIGAKKSESPAQKAPMIILIASDGRRI